MIENTHFAATQTVIILQLGLFFHLNSFFKCLFSLVVSENFKVIFIVTSTNLGFICKNLQNFFQLRNQNGYGSNFILIDEKVATVVSAVELLLFKYIMFQ